MRFDMFLLYRSFICGVSWGGGVAKKIFPPSYLINECF